MPLGDIHIGAQACEEDKFRAVVSEIEEDDNCYWVGLGDYCDFINISDPRFSVASQAPWIKLRHLGDLAAAQRDRFLDIVTPIAGKCLGLVQGNHELVIQRHYERDIYGEIVAGVKKAADLKPDRKLGFGYAGWLVLNFYRGKTTRSAATKITISLHHGFVGGKLKGAKALNMQRWLWSHDCDIAIFGHSHNTDIQTEAVRQVDRAGNLGAKIKLGCYAGTFLRGVVEEASTYVEVKGYFPQPTGGVVIHLRPGAENTEDRISIQTRGLS